MRFFSSIKVFFLIVSLLVPFLFVSTGVHAAAFSRLYVRIDRMSAATATGGMVCVTPATTATEASVQVTFPSDFSLNTTAANWTTTTTNLPNGTIAWPGIGTASSVSGQTVTFPSGDLTVGTAYCFNFAATSTLTTGTAGNNKLGSVTTRTSVPATIDSSSYATAIVSNDQIVVTATVPATFSFSLSSNTDSLGTLSTTASSSAGATATVATNAPGGWIAWVKSANAGLNSVSTGASIPTAGTVDNAPTDLASATGYVLDVDMTTDGGGTGTMTQVANWGAEYAGANTTSGGTLSTTFQPIAASNGTTDGDVMTLIERAKIPATQAAASDYTDTLTVVAAGRF